MTPEQLKKLFNTAKGIASARGYSEHSEDIAQEVLIKAMELGFKPRIEWMVIDHIRKEYGDSRTGSGRAKQRGTRYAYRLDAPIGEESETLGHDLIGSEPIDPIPEPGLERFDGCLSGVECGIFEMIHMGDEDQKTVAEFYGYTQGHISQIKKRIDLKLVRAMVKPEEFPDEMNFDLGVIEL